MVAPLLRGVGKEVMWGTHNKKLVKKGLQYMLEEMGGWQAKCWVLTSEKKRPERNDISEDALDVGFDFIEA